ncbi:MAG: hypothetical protein M3024_11130 [Candidatus Dormibacteraeota bacterium]|nr:hypothetical protein [Candidatus Dormibacteraeota bacterium]
MKSVLVVAAVVGSALLGAAVVTGAAGGPLRAFAGSAWVIGAVFVAIAYWLLDAGGPGHLLTVGAWAAAVWLLLSHTPATTAPLAVALTPGYRTLLDAGFDLSLVAAVALVALYAYRAVGRLVESG